MVIGLRTEPDFLHSDFDLLGLNFLLLFLLLIKELLIIEDFADRRISGRRNLDKIEFLIIGHFHSLLDRVYARIFDIISNETYLGNSDAIINPMFSLWLLGATASLKGTVTTITKWATSVVGDVHHALRLLFF